ncbi:MAG: AAA family ATPase [Elusimicrobiota bacterium]|nr:AAA family ATPase [Elusimicrobiota bacterium]
MPIKRYLSDIAFSNKFSRQMRFITGPRQSGKTIIAKQCLAHNKSNLYYNWDNKSVRKKFRSGSDFVAEDLLKISKRKNYWACFDEIHKMPHWKNILKDFFDTHEETVKFIVTGSARLDMFRNAGDSLSGRYFLFKLNPLILSEIIGSPFSNILPEANALDYLEKTLAGKKAFKKDMSDLLKYSGFPEPLIKADDLFHKKWVETYLELIVDHDIRDLSRIHQLESVKQLLSILPSKIGSPLSINSIREDLEVNFLTAKNYIEYLCKTCVLFKVSPYSSRKNRLVKKEQKVYFYDWTLAGNNGARFENYVAMEIKTRIDLWNDSQKDNYKLYFVRSRTGLETDFLITKNNVPWLLCEAKISSEGISSQHRRHSAILEDIPLVQIVLKNDVLRVENKKFFTVSASRFFS